MPIELFDDREREYKAWMKRVECRRSTGKLTKVLRMKDPFNEIKGFDHTRMYLFQNGNNPQHLIMTEPYDHAINALHSLSEMTDRYGGKPITYLCKRGYGIWNPPSCTALFVVPSNSYLNLEYIASQLPYREFEKLIPQT
jgi:hypothetical protein